MASYPSRTERISSYTVSCGSSSWLRICREPGRYRIASSVMTRMRCGWTYSGSAGADVWRGPVESGCARSAATRESQGVGVCTDRGGSAPITEPRVRSGRKPRPWPRLLLSVIPRRRVWHSDEAFYYSYNHGEATMKWFRLFLASEWRDLTKSRCLRTRTIMFLWRNRFKRTRYCSYFNTPWRHQGLSFEWMVFL